MGVEMEKLAGFQPPAVKVCGAEDEGAGPIVQPAGSCAAGGAGFKQTAVSARGAQRAGGHFGTFRYAGGAAQRRSECAAQDVGSLAGREANWFSGAEFEPQPEERKIHRLPV